MIGRGLAGQIVLTQYDLDGVLECLFVNVEITEVEMTSLNDVIISDSNLVLFPNPANTTLNIVVNFNSFAFFNA